MLTLKIPKQHIEYFDEEKEEFLPPVDIKETELQLEHSLVALKKWEQKYHKPFLKESEEKTYEEMIDYIRCMTLTENVDPNVFQYLPDDCWDKVLEYIKDTMTASWITETGQPVKQSREAVTAEIIYYWMITLNIPIEFENWHLNQLMMLIKIVNIKNSPPKKMDPKEAAKQRDELNRKRRAMWNSKG